MNPLVEKILGGLVRLLLLPVFNWLVVHGVLNATDDTAFYADLTAFVLGAAWVIWGKVKDQRVLNTALGSTDVKTITEVKEQVQGGTFASALTPKDAVPIVRNNSGETR